MDSSGVQQGYNTDTIRIQYGYNTTIPRLVAQWILKAHLEYAVHIYLPYSSDNHVISNITQCPVSSNPIVKQDKNREDI